jgi:hypothetical protein
MTITLKASAYNDSAVGLGRPLQQGRMREVTPRASGEDGASAGATVVAPTARACATTFTLSTMCRRIDAATTAQNVPKLAEDHRHHRVRETESAGRRVGVALRDQRTHRQRRPGPDRCPGRRGRPSSARVPGLLRSWT